MGDAEVSRNFPGLVSHQTDRLRQNAATKVAEQVQKEPDKQILSSRRGREYGAYGRYQWR